ncbi:beta-ketoacyl-[acyl-carrier-protein] synthase II [Fluviispira sanaruensis]|uniref:3-oxoacyl-[acyl-carrier-protein] synthase 2 n=2 Tax=Fluviispira sanaruensis TaxID=2493639 RepID=A0A4P2VPW3_FLUSA|nr:beta-ketoacyl-ACP synthase II [Fluviispira sanaruensis]BBH54330.1 beta-ketoacyl-[acyl-carrier-protein] synthase II [Fluviispira sanaruensis]
MKRVVVTGLGIVCPIGNNLEECWENAIAGKSGIGKLTTFEPPENCVTIAGEVKNFNPADFMDEKEAKRNQRFVHLAVAASKMALENAQLKLDLSNQNDIGVAIGVGIGALGYLEDQSFTARTKGIKRVSPFTIPGFIGNMAAGVVSLETGAKGPNVCTATACSSAGHAIGDALMYIQTGRAKAMICGGAESALSLVAFAGFGQMKALSSDFSDHPEKASRPFDKDRSGFIMGEGSGILIIEEYEYAKARGANIICELVGFGASGDAYHFTSPAPGGEGGARAMQQALSTSGLKPEDVDYINAHGTSTGQGDLCETQAIKTIFGDHAYKLNVSSTKSMTGHLLGAAGGIEAVFSAMAIKTGIIPPTINLDHPDEQCDLNFTANKAVRREVNVAISNSFGFGGTNVCLALRKIRD